MVDSLANFTWSDGSSLEIVRRQEFEPDDFSRTTLTVPEMYTKGISGNLSVMQLAALAMHTTNIAEIKLVIDRIPDNFRGTITMVGPDTEGRVHFLLPPEPISE